MQDMLEMMKQQMQKQQSNNNLPAAVQGSMGAPGGAAPLGVVKPNCQPPAPPNSAPPPLHNGAGHPHHGRTQNGR